MSMPVAELVGIKRSAARSDSRADCRAFLSPAESAYAGTRSSRARYRQFVTMLLPKCTAMTAMTTYRLGGRNWHRRKSQDQRYQ